MNGKITIGIMLPIIEPTERQADKDALSAVSLEMIDKSEPYGTFAMV